MNLLDYSIQYNRVIGLIFVMTNAVIKTLQGGPNYFTHLSDYFVFSWCSRADRELKLSEMAYISTRNIYLKFQHSDWSRIRFSVLELKNSRISCRYSNYSSGHVRKLKFAESIYYHLNIITGKYEPASFSRNVSN